MNPHATPQLIPSTTLRLPRPLRAEIEEWARASHPLEACGLLLGSNVGALVVVTEVRGARNLNVERAHDRYDLDPLDLLAAENDARARALEVVGIWHSHPDHPAEPSETDRARAWHRWSYVIVSVSSEGAGEVRSFRLVHADGDAESGGRFVAEAIEG
jgi:proteasome lid subunit RPN8/RPN11